MFSPEQIEELRLYFAPKTEVVTKLPDIRSVVEFTNLIVEANSTKTLYIAIRGEWKLVAVLT